MSSEGLVLFIVGPTGVGKTDFAVRLGEDFHGEIVNADSRQVYRYMDIGTAKPTRDQMEAVPHHLINVIEPYEQYSLALFLRQAKDAIAEIRSHGRLPIVVGGTGQYVRGLLEGWIVPEVEPDFEVRRQLEFRSEVEGVGVLHRELARLDPVAAGRVDPNNPRRVVRALELQRIGGPPDKPMRESPCFKPVVLGLTLDRTLLYRRIDERIDNMVAAGWVEEVRDLLRRGCTTDSPAMSGIGYREVAAYLDGEMPLDDAVGKTKSRTHRLVRQQYNWFRPDDQRINWFVGTDDSQASAAAWLRGALVLE